MQLSKHRWQQYRCADSCLPRSWIPRRYRQSQKLRVWSLIPPAYWRFTRLVLLLEKCRILVKLNQPWLSFMVTPGTPTGRWRRAHEQRSRRDVHPTPSSSLHFSMRVLATPRQTLPISKENWTLANIRMLFSRFLTGRALPISRGPIVFSAGWPMPPTTSASLFPITLWLSCRGVLTM